MHLLPTPFADARLLQSHREPSLAVIHEITRWSDANGHSSLSEAVRRRHRAASIKCHFPEQVAISLAGVCFGAHYGLESGVAPIPESATERTRFRGRGWRRGRAITSAAVTL